MSNITATTADISWTGNSAAYALEYGTENFSAGTGTTIDNINISLTTLTGLIPDMEYSVYVRSKCSDAAYSVWSERISFRTATNGISGIKHTTSDINIYPNPAKDQATVSIIGINGEVALTIVDMSGRIVKESTVFCGGEECTATIELRDIPAGTYFVRAATESSNSVRRLVVK